MSNKKFTIECEMEERWVDYFCSMLKNMQYNGEVGHSGSITLFSDGDGDFRPKFDIKTNFNRVDPIRAMDAPFDENGKFYDAG